MIPRIDWSATVHPGRDAETSGACTVFAVAHWLEAVTGSRPDDEAIIAAYQAERVKRYPDSGGAKLTMPEGFFAAYAAGWLPAGTTMRRTTDLDRLAYGPLLAAYSVTSGWHDRDPERGLVSISGDPIGSHAVCILGYDGIHLQFANSWGTEWGAAGFGRIRTTDHLYRCKEMWQVIIPGQPSTPAEAARAAAAGIPQTLRDQLAALHLNLLALGYAGLPADPDLVMPDIIRRSMTRQLTADQERAKSNLAAVYLLLVQAGMDAAKINAAWRTLQEASK
jgi:hypothetical protein